jgi:cellulose synthase/poly-beta-1,6-N-acetylglucosamine synthase-like glycosyltransferase
MTAAVLVFSACAGFVIYVLAVYPLLLSFWAKARPQPIRKAPVRTRVSIVVPVRNGARWIEAKIRSLLETRYPGELIDVLIVSDGSTDGSDEIVSRYPDVRVRLLALPPGGKAVAVNRGIENVSGEIVVLTDVRQTFDPGAIPRLLACFAEPGVGVVTGELVIREGANREEYNTGLYWRYEKAIRRNLNRIDAMLGATGSIYAIRRELAPRIPADVLLDDVYVPFAVALRGFRIFFEDEAKAYDLPTALHAEFWRKVRTQAGVYQILFHFPALLSPFNRRFIHFLSHKLGRLLLPFALLGAALASFFLPEPWRVAALGLQGIFYGLALADPFVPERSRLKRLSAVVRAFVVLTAAAGCALAVFVLPARQLWKETRRDPAGR